MHSQARVLVADDCKDAAGMLAMLLKLWGHEALVTYNGPDALEAALDYRPDIIISDLGLPGMDGFELAQALRSHEVLEGVLLIALTGYGQEEFRRRSRVVGFDHFLVKPIDPKELRELLGGVVAAGDVA